MKYLLYGTIALVLVFIILNSLHYDGVGIFVSLIEWTTRFILPWVALYWFIRYVKDRERK